MPTHNYHRIIVKFDEGSNVRLRDGGLRSLNGAEVNSALAALRAPTVLSVSRLFKQSEAELDTLRQTSSLRSSTPLADMNLYYVVQLDSRTSEADARAYIDHLKSLDGVQTAYPTPLPAPPPSQTLRDVSPDFTTQQGYFNPAPYGVNRAAIASLTGGLGDGVTFVDIEYMWNYDHEDYQLDVEDLLAGDEYTGFGYDHGTAVIGQVVALDNGFGITGLTPNADAKVASPMYDEVYNIAQTLLDLTPMLSAGDVVLIEQQAYPSFNIDAACKAALCYNFVPVEIVQDVFDAIQYMVAAGIVVVEAGANGGYDLDHPVFGGLFNRDVRDSGAILVGAANPDTRRDYSWSNVGSRVDVYAWGGLIYTTGYGDAYNNGVDGNQDYTADFGGTSGASPIVTGAVIALQGIAKAEGDLLTPLEIRALLRSNGTPHHPLSYKIGAMPDLATALMNYLHDDAYFLSNRGFEVGATAWTVKQTGGGDKVICAAKNVAVGACSFMFTSSPKENSRLTQTVDVSAAGLDNGDTVYLTYRLKANAKVSKGFAKLILTYTSGAKQTKQSKFTPTGGSFVQKSVAIPLGYPLQSALVEFRYRGTTGKAWIDDVRLCVGGGAAPCP